MSVCKKLLDTSFLLSRSRPVRFALSSRNVGAYKGHGKTVVEVLNKREGTDVLMIATYSQIGFRLNNRVLVVGPMIIHENTVLGWNIKNDEAITEDSLEFFRHIVPALDLIIIGLSEDKSLKTFNKDLIATFRKLSIPLEILPSARACQTYNFVAGIRNVAAALLPPRRFEFHLSETIDEQARQNILFKGSNFLEDLAYKSTESESIPKHAKRINYKPK